MALSVTAKGEREIVIARVFDAPRAAVFAAFTRRDLISRWFAPPGWWMEICEIDFRPGGSFRYLMRGPEGTSMGMHGISREVTPPARLVNVERYDDWFAGDSLVITEFVEIHGQTTITTTVQYPSKETRDMVMESPMQLGTAAAYGRLDAMLAGRLII